MDPSGRGVCGRSHAGIGGFESRRRHGYLPCGCCVLSGRGFSAGMITHRSPQCPMSVITKPRKGDMTRNHVEAPQKKKIIVLIDFVKMY